MPGIITRPLRSQQPLAAQINAAHAAFAGGQPALAYSAASWLFDANGRALTQVGAVARQALAGGAGVQASGNTNRIGLPAAMSPPTGVFTVVIGFRVPSISGTAPLFCTSAVASGGAHIGVKAQTSTSTFELRYGDGVAFSSSSRRSFQTPGGSVVAGRYHSVVAVVRGPTDASIYMDGISRAVTYSGTAAGYAAGTQAGALLDIYESSGYLGGDKTLSHVVVIPGAIPDALAQQLSINPWQLFAPQPRRLWAVDPSSGGVTGALAAAESGADAAAIAGAVVVHGSLAAAESGGDSVALSGRVIVGGVLAAAEAGADAAVIAGRIIVSGAIAAAETGGDAASIIGGAVPAITGSLAATESGADTASIAGRVIVSGALGATETGGDTASIRGPSGASAGWDEVLSNGLTSGETLVQIHWMLSRLHQMHGLRDGVPLAVGQTQRAAGDIVQSVTTEGGVTVVSLQ